MAWNDSCRRVEDVFDREGFGQAYDIAVAASYRRYVIWYDLWHQYY